MSVEEVVERCLQYNISSSRYRMRGKLRASRQMQNTKQNSHSNANYEM